MNQVQAAETGLLVRQLQALANGGRIRREHHRHRAPTHYQFRRVLITPKDFVTEKSAGQPRVDNTCDLHANGFTELNHFVETAHQYHF